ncbi:MAG: GtrA family protein [Betaproteobacteria bacterium]|nr:GtrA family protein [Betaproteobacteria bacterium]NBT10179.1 GtrA family protein [Betaproteobacteria bacterium]NBU49888.1 GtrA family protein [Betaproteobacteria bacterium]NBX95715.1 GtrA family protein [Betaproteobacteria bacterium]
MNRIPRWSRLGTLPAQLVKYAGVGGVSAIFHYGTLVACVEWLKVSPVPASVAASGVGAGVNYLLNYHYTFRSDRHHGQSVPRFLTVAATGAGLNAGLMFLGVHLIEIHYLLAQLLSTAIVFFWNFLINRSWTFRPHLK